MDVLAIILWETAGMSASSPIIESTDLPRFLLSIVSICTPSSSLLSIVLICSGGEEISSTFAKDSLTALPVRLKKVLILGWEVRGVGDGMGDVLLVFGDIITVLT